MSSQLNAMGEQNTAQASSAQAEEVAGTDPDNYEADMMQAGQKMMEKAKTEDDPGKAQEDMHEGADDEVLAKNPSMAANATPQAMQALAQQGDKLLGSAGAGIAGAAQSSAAGGIGAAAAQAVHNTVAGGIGAAAAQAAQSSAAGGIAAAAAQAAQSSAAGGIAAAAAQAAQSSAAGGIAAAAVQALQGL
jgi:hypothetical protein